MPINYFTYNVKTLTLADGLPKRIGQLADAPKKLYLKGDFNFEGPVLAIVGTRSPSRYGTVVIEQLIRSLKGRGNRDYIRASTRYGRLGT